MGVMIWWNTIRRFFFFWKELQLTESSMWRRVWIWGVVAFNLLLPRSVCYSMAFGDRSLKHPRCDRSDGLFSRCDFRDGSRVSFILSNFCRYGLLRWKMRPWVFAVPVSQKRIGRVTCWTSSWWYRYFRRKREDLFAHYLTFSWKSFAVSVVYMLGISVQEQSLRKLKGFPWKSSW